MLSIVALVPVTGLVAWQVRTQREASRDDIAIETVRLSRILSERLAGQLAEVGNALDTAVSVVPADGRAQSCSRQTAVVRELASSVTAAVVLGPSNEVHCASGADRSPQLGASWRVNGSTDGVLLGHEPSGSVDQDPVLVVAREVPELDGVVLVAAIDLGPELERFVTDYALDDGSAVSLVEPDGYVVAAHPDTGEGRRLPARPLVEQMSSGAVEAAAQTSDVSGVERTYSFVDVGASGGRLFAVVGTSLSSAEAIAGRQMRSNLVVAGLVMLVALVASALVAEMSVARPLRTMRDRLIRIGSGDLAARSQQDVTVRELAEVDRDIDVMAERLEQRAVSLKLAIEERHRLLDELLTVQDEERRKVAADIHDDTIQSMIASGLAVQLVRHEITDPAALERLRVVEDRIAAAIARLRQLMFELEPVGTAGDLTAAVEQYLESALDRPVELDVSCSDLCEPSGSIRQVLFRNLRECVLNASRHGAASRIDVELTSVQNGIEAIVSDDGTGMTSTAARRAGHHGMRVMRERVEALGGSMAVESAPGAGTTVYFWIPLGPVPAMSAS